LKECRSVWFRNHPGRDQLRQAEMDGFEVLSQFQTGVPDPLPTSCETRFTETEKEGRKSPERTRQEGGYWTTSEETCLPKRKNGTVPKQGGHRRSMTSLSVKVQISPESVPSTQRHTFGEVTLMAHVFTQRGWLTAIAERVRFARARMGTYDTIDFLVVPPSLCGFRRTHLKSVL